MMGEPKACVVCNGYGYEEKTVLQGYVTHEMAIDGGDRQLEGQPVYEDIKILCDHCQGSGYEPEVNDGN